MVRTAFCCALLALSSLAALAETPRLSTPAPAALPFARQHLVTSAATGRSYRIQVSPVGKAPAGGYPLVLVLDGDVMLPAVATAAQGMHMAADENGVGPMLVVGVGYEKAELLDEQARAEDYTPPAPDLSQTGDTRATRQGGADRFLRFLRDELKPAIADAYPVDASRTALLGHSYGGLFALYALLQHPALAQTYVASSPSVWWNKAHIAQELERAAASLPAARVRISIGEYEQTPSPRIDAQSPRAGRCGMPAPSPNGCARISRRWRWSSANIRRPRTRRRRCTASWTGCVSSVPNKALALIQQAQPAIY